MSCTITYTKVELDSENILHIEGTATECDIIMVKVEPYYRIEKTDNVDDDGSWSVDFIPSEWSGEISLEELRAAWCGKEIKIQSECDDGSCRGPEHHVLTCVDEEEDKCPDVSVTIEQGDCNTNNDTRVMTFVVSVEGNAQIQYRWNFGDGTPLTPITTRLGSFREPHAYLAGDTYYANLILVDPLDCAATPDPIQVIVESCTSDEDSTCPVTRVTIVLEDQPGIPDYLECIPPGRYTVRSVIEPDNATSEFSWAVDGQSATIGQRGVVEIIEDRMTIDIETTIRSISVIAAQCLSDGIELRPCEDDTEEVCCPNLDGLTATCMTRCPQSTAITLTATGENLECAEVFRWDFGDGTSIETNEPVATHTYPEFSSFVASATLVRPQQCGSPRTQQRTVTVSPCSPDCRCVWLAITFAFSFIALLALLPLIACVSESTARAALIIALIIVTIILFIVGTIWLLDPCCRPTQCELNRIFYWVFTWAAFITGLVFVLSVFCSSAIPFGAFYIAGQQYYQGRINDSNCTPGAPVMWEWPFPQCQS